MRTAKKKIKRQVRLLVQIRQMMPLKQLYKYLMIAIIYCVLRTYGYC